jgi:hypothetical protein
VGDYLEAELRVLIEDLQPAGLVVAAIGADKLRIREQSLKIGTHPFAAGWAGIA